MGQIITTQNLVATKVVRLAGQLSLPARQYPVMQEYLPGNSVTRYQSLEINYHTTPNNERTALPILKKIINALLYLSGRAEYINMESIAHL